VLADTAAVAQGFVGGYLHLTFGLVPQPWPFHLHLAVGQMYLTGLRPVPADVAPGLPRCLGARDLLGAQHQNRFQSLASELVDDCRHHLAGTLDHLDDGKQDLPIRLAELLNDGGGFAFGPRHDIRFLHGGLAPFRIRVWQPDSIETGANRRT
jgi:hypothetical protein